MATEDQNETLPPAQQSPPEEDKPKEVTKRSIRLDTWQKIKDQKLSPLRRFSVFNKIPNYVGADKAAEMLAETDEFKNATNIKVNIDLAQEPVKVEVVKAHKTLFVPPAQKSSNVYAKIKNCNPDELDLATQKKIIKLQGDEDTFEEIDINGIEKLDMVVVGSCAVSRQGHRIGKGNGYVDLDVGILTDLGVVTKDTLIATTVHDVQVYDTLPENLFQSYDLPLDLIVTPTEVIRVSKRLHRPKGIEWKLLSSRRLEIVPVLKCIKEREEKSGAVIELKEEDTDVESYQQKSRNRRSFRRNQSGQRRRRRSDRRASEKQQNGDGESHDEEGAEKTDGEGGKQGGGRPPRRNRVRRGPRRSTNNKDESAAEKSEGEEKEGADREVGGDGERKKGRRDSRRTRDKNPKGGERKGGRVERDLCIRVTNIARTMRIKELKQELRTRECNPIFITWNGYHGKCYLHFPKKPEQTDDDAGAELLKQLEDLTLTVTPREKEGGGEPKQVTLKCEVMKRKEGDGGDQAQPDTNGTVLEGSRIETTDVTAV